MSYQLEQHSSNPSQPFVIEKSLPLLENITLIGTKNRPIITRPNQFLLTYLFDHEVNVWHTTRIYIENIWFKGIGIVRVKDPTALLAININNCVISDVLHYQTSFIIDSLAKKTLINIKSSLIYDFIRGINLESSFIDIKIQNSELLYHGEKKVYQECPQLIVVNKVMSLFVELSNAKFKRVVLINMMQVEGSNKRNSNIKIIHSTFDDERPGASFYECPTKMSLLKVSAVL